MQPQEPGPTVMWQQPAPPAPSQAKEHAWAPEWRDVESKEARVTLQVPEGAPPGTLLAVAVKTPRGREQVKVRVPDGAGPGSTLILMQPENSEEWSVKVADVAEVGGVIPADGGMPAASQATTIQNHPQVPSSAQSLGPSIPRGQGDYPLDFVPHPLFTPLSVPTLWKPEDWNVAHQETTPRVRPLEAEPAQKLTQAEPATKQTQDVEILTERRVPALFHEKEDRRFANDNVVDEQDVPVSEFHEKEDFIFRDAFDDGHAQVLGAASALAEHLKEHLVMPVHDGGHECAKSEEPSLEELRDALEERQAAIIELRHEIQMLRAAPPIYEKRLAELEAGVLGEVKAGTILEVKAPVLHGIHEVIKEDHHLIHDQHVTLWSPEGYSHFGPSLPENFVMGRHYMPLDQKHKEEIQRKEEAKQNSHPSIEEPHYAGFMAAPAIPQPHDLEGDGFWLDFDEQHPQHLPPPERWAHRHDEAGGVEDAIPIDWLGRAKRGLPATKRMHHTAGVPPRWLY